MDKGCIIINIIYNVINSEGLGNIIAFFALIIGIITVRIGYNKFNEFRQEAIFGFHINIFIFIRRLKVFFTKKEQLETENLENANNIFSLLSNNGDIRREYYSVYESKGKELRDLSFEFLQYLSNAQKQVPPKNYENEKWYNDITVLVEFLSRFSQIGKERFYAEYNNPIDILNANNKFFNLLLSFEDILNEEKGMIVSRNS